MSPLTPSHHCICWWPNTLTPKATHRKPTTWDGRRDQLWLRLTSREHPSWGRLSPGRLMEAYFTSCHSSVVPIAKLEVIPILPSAPAPLGLIPDSLYILRRSSCCQNPSQAQVERTRLFYKYIFTTLCLFFTLMAVPQNSELTAKTWTGQMSLSYMLSLPFRFH